MNENLNMQSQQNVASRSEPLDDGGPAFPVPTETMECGQTRTLGMEGLTKLEYFAGLAMQGLLASDSDQRLDQNKISDWSVGQAKSLIKALNRQTDEKHSTPQTT